MFACVCLKMFKMYGLTVLLGEFPMRIFRILEIYFQFMLSCFPRIRFSVFKGFEECFMDGIQSISAHIKNKRKDVYFCQRETDIEWSETRSF